MGKAKPKRKPAKKHPPKPRKYKFYSDADRYAALAAIDANGGIVSVTANQLGIPEPTLRAWKSGFRSASSLQVYEKEKGDLASAIEKVVWRLVDVAPDKIDDAPLNQVMTGIGIGVDKMRLLRGESTNINDNNNRNANLNVDKLVAMLTDEQRRAFIELLTGQSESSDGSSMARLPETSGIPITERELPTVSESGVQDQRPLNDVP